MMTVFQRSTLNKDYGDRIFVQTAPSYCKDLIGLTLTNDSECIIEEESIENIDLKRDFSVLVACLRTNLSMEPAQDANYQIENFQDEFAFASRLQKIKNGKQRIFCFVVVSHTRGKLIVPIIHSNKYIERIYMYEDTDNDPDSSWALDYTKIKYKKTEIGLLSQLENDIEQFIKRPLRWTRSPKLFIDLWKQKSTSDNMRSYTYKNDEKFDMHQIVTLYFHEERRFILQCNDTASRDFDNIGDCSNFLDQQTISSIFLIICGNFDNDLEPIGSLINYDSIHATYFLISSGSKRISEPEKLFTGFKISGVFTSHKIFLMQLVSDIGFYRQIHVYTPKMGILKADSEVLARLDEGEKEFLRYQLFIDDTISKPVSLIDDQLGRTNFIDNSNPTNINIDLNPDMVELFKVYDLSTLLENSKLIHIDKEIRSLPSTILPSPMTVYRAQIISNDDLLMIQKNPNATLAIYSFVMVSKSYPSVIEICRCALDNGLTVAFYEIKLFKKTSVRRLSSNPETFIFPAGTTFRLKSIEQRIDSIWHVEADLINFDLSDFKAQLEFKTRRTGTLSTINDYWNVLS